MSQHALGNRCLASFLFPALFVLSYVAPAATLPTGFTETLIAGGLSAPTAFAIAPDGRIFICQQGGALRVIKNNVLLSTPFITLPVRSDDERGLLGIAFDPNFATNQFVYVYYTANTGSNRAVRLTASGDVAVAGSQVVLLDLAPQIAANHNGGAMHFGPDGKLYIATGEHGEPSLSPRLDKLVGKILRINPDGSIPTNNPFYNSTTGVYRSIWAKGLRNPFTFDFQPGTGRMFINDVGAGLWEEINDGIAGSDYGWPATEGTTTNPAYRSPLFVYARGIDGCAITGAAFYNPPVNNFPNEYAGRYFFGDYCNGKIRVFNPSTATASDFASNIGAAVDIHVGNDGALYYLAYAGGAIYRVTHTGSAAPHITSQPVDAAVNAGQTATFRVTASGSSPLTYVWRKNNVVISGATSSVYTTPPATTNDNGAVYRVTVSNANGSDTSDPAFLTVTSNRSPTATINGPVAGSLYTAGGTILFSGGATDPEDGNLSAGSLTWRIDFHHDTHSHPALAPTSGIASGSYTVPTVGETSHNVWYRITLTARDSEGLTHTVFRDVMPRKATMAFRTSPTGLRITLDGQPMLTPVNVTGVVGVRRTLGVISPQTLSGTSYGFSAWSDSGAATHTISTPGATTTYTATFTFSAPVVAVTSPTSGQTVSGTIMTRATATGNAGVVGVQFFVDGQPRGAEDTSAAYAILLNTAGLANGNHIVTARARDAAGNTSTSPPVTFRVNNTASSLPVVSVTSPSSGQTVAGTTMLRATATDDVGVVGVQFFIDGKPRGAEDRNVAYAVLLNTTTLSNGSHVVTARARDAAGNMRTSPPVLFTVNNTFPPQVSITSPLSGQTVSGMIALRANATDDAGVVGVQFFIDGKPRGAEDTSAAYAVLLNTITLTNGMHSVTAKARDAAGNTKTSAAVTFKVNNAAGPLSASNGFILMDDPALLKE